VGPLRLYDWAGDGDVVDTSVVVPLLSLRVEVDAGPPSDHVNGSAIWLISEVFLLWCLGVIWVVDVWLMRVRRLERRWYDLYLLVVLVCVVRWMQSGAVVVWLW
jgi:NhaP-type Na+/H+ or K+/H+ antiporter